MLDCHYNISTPLSQFLSTFKIMNEAGPGQALISYQIEANRLQKIQHKHPGLGGIPPSSGFGLHFISDAVSGLA